METDKMCIRDSLKRCKKLLYASNSSCDNGNSQSMSMPSNSYLLAKAIILVTVSYTHLKDLLIVPLPNISVPSAHIVCQ